MRRGNLAEFQRDELENKEPWSVHRWRHGGDLAGVKSRLRRSASC